MTVEGDYQQPFLADEDLEVIRKVLRFHEQQNAVALLRVSEWSASVSATTLAIDDDTGVGGSTVPLPVRHEVERVRSRLDEFLMLTVNGAILQNDAIAQYVERLRETLVLFLRYFPNT